MGEENERIEVSLRELFDVLRHKMWMIVLTAAAGGILFWSFSYYFVTPSYQSTAKIYIVSGSTDSMVSLNDLQIGTSLTKDYLTLVKSRPVLEEVAKNLGVDISYRRLAGKISVSNGEGTRIVNITAADTDPQISKDIANETANVVKKQIPVTMQTSEPTIVEKAVSGVRTGPNYMRYAQIGVLSGLLLSTVLLAVFHLLDDSIHNAEEMEHYLGVHTLASVPLEGGTDNQEKQKSKRKWVNIGIRAGRKGVKLWGR